MRILITFSLLLINCFAANGQDNDKIAAIVEEGKKLYRTELASWHATDILLERFDDLTSIVGGYFSYLEGENARCVFFSNEADPRVLLAITFDNTYNINEAKVESAPRSFTGFESDLYNLRQAASEIVYKDASVKTYTNTALNLVPLIRGSEKKVYVMSGPEVPGVVILGNDHLLTFDENNKLLSKKQLHNDIIPLPYEEGESVNATMHTHDNETGHYITATDVCTLKLYGELTGWKQHAVISDKYVTVWDYEKDTFISMTRAEWDEMMKGR